MSHHILFPNSQWYTWLSNERWSTLQCHWRDFLCVGLPQGMRARDAFRLDELMAAFQETTASCRRPKGRQILKKGPWAAPPPHQRRMVCRSAVSQCQCLADPDPNEELEDGPALWDGARLGSGHRRSEWRPSGRIRLRAPFAWKSKIMPPSKKERLLWVFFRFGMRWACGLHVRGPSIHV